MDNVAYNPGGLARLSTLLGAPEAALRLLVSILLGKYITSMINIICIFFILEKAYLLFPFSLPFPSFPFGNSMPSGKSIRVHS